MKLQQPGSMKLWKSPVLYFGVLLVVAVVGLLLAPVVIDWNGYRSDLEAYGRKLTGREVTIKGPVSARLFPWPRLTAEQVSIANPPGLTEPDFATAERITIRMTLAGLLQGGLNVQSIEIERPSIRLERRATGEGNWQFSPSADLVKSDILSRVRLDEISLTGGTVSFSDRRRGETLTLEDVSAEIASPGVTGPWRIRTKSFYEGQPLDVAINTAAYAEGEPFRFGVRAAAADGSGYAFGFDGALKDGKAEGDIRIEPASADQDGKSDAEGRIRPLLFTAKAAGDFDRVDFRDIEVSRIGPDENGGALTTGSATLSLGSHITAGFDLKAALLDLDQLAGKQSRDVLRQAGSLGVGASLLGLIPPDMNLDGRMEVTALKSGGQTLDNVELSVAAARDELRIARFAAGFPGRSRMLFSGLFAPGRSGPELNGNLALETSDLRELTFWLWPQGQERFAKMWSGSRGRLKLETDVGLTTAWTRFSNAQYELDGEQGRGSLSYTSAGRGAVELTLEGSRFDIDSYAPGGIPALSVATHEGAASGLIALAMPRPEAPDLVLRVTAGEVQLNAVAARDVTIDLKSAANGLELQELAIGSVGGANVTALGRILDAGNGADGKINLDIKADDPSGLIMLLGLGGSDGLPPWARGLGATSVIASLAVKPVDNGSELQLKASGNAGELSIKGQGTASPGGEVTGNLNVTAPSSARILALLGINSTASDDESGSLTFEAAGTAVDGFLTSASVEAHGGRLDYRGMFNPWAEGLGLGGQLTLRALDASGLVAASGIPATVGPGGLAGQARVAWEEGKWTLSDMSGTLGSEKFSVSASLTPELQTEIRIETGPLRLPEVLAATFLDWTGPDLSLETGFSSGLPLGLTGQLWLTPSSLEVMPHFQAHNAEIGIEARAGELRLSMYGKDKDGRDARLELASAGAEDSRKLSGLVSLPLDLGQQLRTIVGAPVAEGQGSIEVRFESEGRSPAGALAALKGQGSYKVDGFRLLSMTPADFATALAAAKDAAGITGAFDRLRGGAGTDFGNVSGSVAVTDGQVSFSPITRQDAAADIEVKTMGELALGQIDVDIGLRFKLRDGLPPMSVTYAGPAGMLARAEDNSELATALGVTIMQQGIDELERLQQEQQRLAELEDKQRVEDEARLQAYYAQRDELLLRRRELKVHAEMQVAAADRLRRQIETERAANLDINKSEMRQRLRELRTWRRLARLAEAPEAVIPAPPPKPKVVRKSQPPGPVILANPPGAPVVISPPPVSSPSQ